MLKFRPLKENEIEVRVAQVGDGWVQLLLYKNARVDMSILDETVGAENWERSHYECKGNLFCTVKINTNYDKVDCTDRWISKSDCGSESNTEKEKGESSDSFKRACTNWGIGRELYSSPAIFANVETEKNGNGYKMKRRVIFEVSKIEIDKERDKITKLTVVNAKTKTEVFKWQENENKAQMTASKTAPTNYTTEQQKPVTEAHREPESVMNEFQKTHGTTISGKTRVKRGA